MREKPTALLIDLDGVLRHFDLAVAAAAEARHGLEAGAVLRTAFAWGWLRPALTGAISHDEWIAAVATELGNAEAVAEWQQDTGTRQWWSYFSRQVASTRTLRTEEIRHRFTTLHGGDSKRW